MKKIKALLAVAILMTTAINNTYAGTIPQCGSALCPADFDIFFDGKQMGGGQLVYDAETGVVSLDVDNNVRGSGIKTAQGGLMWMMGDGSVARVNSLYGNADPILGFGLGATTASAGRTFSFAFNLPISVSGLIQADSSIDYSLSALTSAGADIAPVFGPHILTARDVDTTPGGLLPLDKEVDVGDRFFFTDNTGPETRGPAAPFTDSALITGSTDYDLMAVQIAFLLSANSTVGISGFVSQVEVPVPAAMPLFLLAISCMGFVGRKKFCRSC